jgi:threonine/homoserine/homoserine lactone efflux protein
MGSITPSMLNMAALKISLEKGRKASNNYALGVSFVVFTQVYIAVFLTKYITENPTILETLEKAGIIIFILLSFYFYKESKKGKIKVEGIRKEKESSFIKGVTLSLLNMFAIPFFCGVIVFLEVYDLFTFDFFSIIFFNIGSVLGTFYNLFLYGKFAKKIQKKTGKLTKDINLVLSILTGLVAIFTIIKIFF